MPRFGRILEVSSLILSGAVLVYIFKPRRSTTRSSEPETAAIDIVEESSIESFPASDAPPWTQGALM